MKAVTFIFLSISLTVCATARQPHKRFNAFNAAMVNTFQQLGENERKRRLEHQKALNNWGGGYVDSSKTINQGYQNVLPNKNVFSVIGE